MYSNCDVTYKEIDTIHCLSATADLRTLLVVLVLLVLRTDDCWPGSSFWRPEALALCRAHQDRGLWCVCVCERDKGYRDSERPSTIFVLALEPPTTFYPTNHSLLYHSYGHPYPSSRHPPSNFASAGLLLCVVVLLRRLYALRRRTAASFPLDSRPEELIHATAIRVIQASRNPLRGCPALKL